MPGTVEAKVRWLEDSLALVHHLRSEGIPLVGYTRWLLFSLLDWAYREGVKPPEAYLWHMGMYDLEPDGRGGIHQDRDARGGRVSGRDREGI